MQSEGDPMLGQWILDQYVVRARLASGGMGVAYVAEQAEADDDARQPALHQQPRTDSAQQRGSERQQHTHDARRPFAAVVSSGSAVGVE